jgi:hypothetical protein
LQAAAEFLAMLCCALFSGAAIYITLVEHPARMECGTELAATVFGPSYRRAAIMQASLAVLGFVAAVTAWLAGSTISWLLGSVLLGLVVPFTLIFIMPTTNQLLAISSDRNPAQTKELLVRWGRLHAVRSVLSLVALLIFLASA